MKNVQFDLMSVRMKKRVDRSRGELRKELTGQEWANNDVIQAYCPYTMVHRSLNHVTYINPAQPRDIDQI